MLVRIQEMVSTKVHETFKEIKLMPKLLGKINAIGIRGHFPF